MHTYRFITGVLIGAFLIGACGSGFGAEDDQAQALDRALMDIRAVEQLIRRKADSAENLRQGLRQQVDDLKAEINQERRHIPVTAFPQAQAFSRIDYDLRLIQRLFGYIELLENRIAYLHSAVDTLEFYRRQLQDDLLFLRALNDAENVDLLHQMIDDLNNFKSQAEKPLSSACLAGLRPLDAIWNDILQGK